MCVFIMNKKFFEITWRFPYREILSREIILYGLKLRVVRKYFKGGIFNEGIFKENSSVLCANIFPFR